MSIKQEIIRKEMAKRLESAVYKWRAANKANDVANALVHVTEVRDVAEAMVDELAGDLKAVA